MNQANKFHGYVFENREKYGWGYRCCLDTLPEFENKIEYGNIVYDDTCKNRFQRGFYVFGGTSPGKSHYKNVYFLNTEISYAKGTHINIQKQSKNSTQKQKRLIQS